MTSDPDESIVRHENRFRQETRYYGLPGGCVRGNKCFYAHGDEQLRKRTRDPEISPCPAHHNSASSSTSTQLQSGKINHSHEDLGRKIFVGGLSSSVESDDLREFFEKKFGPVLDAVVVESHMADQVQSRGFGFVTFENEESVISAVNAHFVNILGKKVEIKGAVPRVRSSQLLFQKGGSGVPMSQHETSRDSAEFDAVRRRPLDTNRSYVTTDVPGRSDTHVQLRESDIAKKAAINTPSTAPSCGPKREVDGHSWMPTFERWLPKFLVDVYNRLKEGEWYPLSSLKGDFRATCGLELDNEAIGFHKLNDFIRSFPHLCKVKIVPVGLGPATHMVLLPAVSTPMTTVHVPVSSGEIHVQEPHRNDPHKTSLVQAGCSYSATICQHGATGSGSVSIMDSWGSAAVVENGENDPRRESVPATEYNVHDAPNLNFLRQQSTLDSTEEKHNWEPRSGLSFIGQTPNFLHHLQGCREFTTPPVSNDRESEYHHHAEVHNPSDFFIQAPSHHIPLEARAHGRHQPNVPLEQLSFQAFSKFRHAMEVHHRSTPATPAYNRTRIWEQNVPNSAVSSVEREGLNVERSGRRHPRGLDPRIFEETVRVCAYLRSKGVLTSVRNRRNSSSTENVNTNDREKHSTIAICRYCQQRRAIWMAFPCRHLALCHACRDSLYWYWGVTNYSPCPVCSFAVEKWYAWYHL